MPFPRAEAISSFPKTVAVEPKHWRDHSCFAVYSLVKLDDPEAFLRAVAVDDNMPDELADSIQFAPLWKFEGKTLGEVVKYHQGLFASSTHGQSSAGDDNGDGHEIQHRFDYSLFIVAVHEDYMKHGVLLASLINEPISANETASALLRCPLQCSLPEYAHTLPVFGWCVNLGIANMGLEELRDQESAIEWPAPIPGYNELQSALKASGQELKRRVQQR